TTSIVDYLLWLLGLARHLSLTRELGKCRRRVRGHHGLPRSANRSPDDWTSSIDIGRRRVIGDRPSRLQWRDRCLDYLLDNAPSWSPNRSSDDWQSTLADRRNHCLRHHSY